jgi:DNA-binding CsgD family transcriptional regulator
MHAMNLGRALQAGHAESMSTAGAAGHASAPGASSPANAPVSAASALGDCIAGLALSGHDQPEPWLAAAAESLRRFITTVHPGAGAPGLGVSAVLLGPGGHDGLLRAQAAATAGLSGPERGAAELLAGAITGEPSRHAAFLQPGCWARRQAIVDDAWATHAGRAQRLGIGLDEFARGTVGVNGPDQPAVLVFQVEHRVGEPWPEVVAVDALRLMTPLLRRVYDATVGRLGLHRAAVLARVSIAQRPIIHLLAEGLTEKQIASRIHRSQHTVHDHVKTIYASLAISTRHELMELWNGRMALVDPGRASLPAVARPGLWIEPRVQLRAG